MSRWLPPAASSHAAGIDFVMLLVHGLMLLLFVGWSVYLAYVLFRFRQRAHPRARPDGASGRFAFATEVAIVVAEAALLVVFALPLWFERTSARPAAPSAIVIRVVAEQFAWTAHYPGADGRFGEARPARISDTNPIGLDRASPYGADDLVVPGVLHVPVNRPVVLELSSKDVIHSFGVPAMRVKQDVVPGLNTPVWFTPIVSGRYEITCSQLCGLAHYRMRGFLVVESAEEFSRFLAEEAAALR